MIRWLYRNWAGWPLMAALATFLTSVTWRWATGNFWLAIVLCLALGVVCGVVVTVVENWWARQLAYQDERKTAPRMDDLDA